MIILKAFKCLIQDIFLSIITIVMLPITHVQVIKDVMKEHEEFINKHPLPMYTSMFILYVISVIVSAITMPIYFIKKRLKEGVC